MTDLDAFYQFEPVPIRIENFDYDGFILDVGGGGEGVIGQLFGKDVIAIDLRKDELEEAKDGPLKIIMDARELQFLPGTFNNATAFFSMMYIKTKEDQQQIFDEVWRVLRPGGRFDLWDIDLSGRPETDKEWYLAFIRYYVAGEEIGTGYGQKWPVENRGIDYYQELAKQSGFKHSSTSRNKHTFHMQFEK